MTHLDKLFGHSDHVQWLRKRGLAAQGLDRQEFGTVQSDYLKQQVVVSHDRGADIVEIHGVKTQLIDIRRDLRMAIVSVSSAFSRATSDEEQSGQKAALWRGD
jgi:hypothetical protein